MRPSSTSPRAAARGAGLRLRVGSSRSRAEWSLREMTEILGPDAVTAASLHGRRRREYITSRAWVRAIVRDELGRPWHGFDVVARGEKPRLRRSTLDVSIAHTGDHLVVAVVPRGRIGVDVEEATAVFDQPALVRRLCTPAEREALEQLPLRARRGWLAQLWSTKEAYAKAHGLGLGMALTGVDASTLAGRHDVWHALTPPTGDPRLKMAITWVDDAPCTLIAAQRR